MKKPTVRKGPAASYAAPRFSEDDAETIMRSKWTRWAGDSYSGSSRYGQLPAKAVADYVRAHWSEMHFQLGITPPQREAP